MPQCGKMSVRVRISKCMAQKKEVSLIRNTNIAALEEDNANLPKVFGDAFTQLENVQLRELSEICNSQVSTGGDFFGEAANFVTGGTYGLDKIKDHISRINSAVSKVRGQYWEIQDVLYGTIDKFIDYRQDVISVYNFYVHILLSLFGDRLRVVCPELFDFSKVEYLEIDSFYQFLSENLSIVEHSVNCKLNQQYDRIGRLNENVDMAYKVGGKKAAAAFAFLDFLQTYEEGKASQAEAKAELSNVKRNVDKLMAIMSADLERMSLIMQSFTTYCIPSAIAVLQYGTSAFDDSITGLLSQALGSDTQAARVFSKWKSANRRLFDLKESLEQEEQRSAELDGDAKTMNAIFEQKKNEGRKNEARVARALAIIFSEDKSDAKQKCTEIKSSIDSIEADFKSDCEKVYSKVHDKLRLSIEAKEQVKSMLDVVIAARQVIGLGVDDKLLAPQKIEEYFCESVVSESQMNEFDNYLNSISSGVREVVKPSENPFSLDNKLCQVLDAGLHLAKATMELKRQEADNAIAVEDYQRQLADIRSQYAGLAIDADQKAELMRQVGARLASSASTAEVCDAFEALSGNKFDESEFDAFLSGNGDLSI